MKPSSRHHIIVTFLPTNEEFDFSVNENLDNFTCHKCNHGNCRHIIFLKNKHLSWVRSIVNPTISQRFYNWMDRNIIPYLSLSITFCAVAIPYVLWRYFSN